MLSLHQLNPSNSRLCLQIAKICRNLGVAPRQGILLAVSGGADSLALALILQIIAPRLDITLHAVHIDHSLRPTSGAEAVFVENFCAEISMPCTIMKADVAAQAALTHCGLEETGRAVRYQYFEKLRQELNGNFIMVGHHLLDLTEDILMRLTRGCGWPGLSGMAWKNGFILRPLLHHHPEELKAFLTSCGFTWVTDPSNASLAFKRNRVRHLLIPMLRCENPSIERSFTHLHDLGALDASYWHEVLEAALANHPWEFGENCILLPKELLQGLHPAARLRLYHRAVQELRQKTGALGQVRGDTLLKLESALQNGIGGKAFQCGGGITAFLRQGKITLSFAHAI